MEIACNHMISVTAGLYLTKNTQVTYHQYPQHMETDQGEKENEANYEKHIHQSHNTRTALSLQRATARPHAEKLHGLEATSEAFSMGHKETRKTLGKHSSEGFYVFSLLFIICVPKYLLNWTMASQPCLRTCVSSHCHTITCAPHSVPAASRGFSHTCSCGSLLLSLLVLCICARVLPTLVSFHCRKKLFYLQANWPILKKGES